MFGIVFKNYLSYVWVGHDQSERPFEATQPLTGLVSSQTVNELPQQSRLDLSGVVRVPLQIRQNRLAEGEPVRRRPETMIYFSSSDI